MESLLYAGVWIIPSVMLGVLIGHFWGRGPVLIRERKLAQEEREVTLKALLWGGIFLLLWIASKYLEDMKHMTVLSGVWNYLASLQPALNPGMASVISASESRSRWSGFLIAAAFFAS